MTYRIINTIGLTLAAMMCTALGTILSLMVTGGLIVSLGITLNDVVFVTVMVVAAVAVNIVPGMVFMDYAKDI